MLWLSTYDDSTSSSPNVDKADPVNINSTRDLAAAVRGRRQDLRLTQADLAARAGVSRVWVSSLEAGKATVEFGLVLRLLDALDLRIDVAQVPNLSDVSKGPSLDLDSLIDEYRGR
jgi:HTH-type transcriptional regulator/antitoxin HipB